MDTVFKRSELANVQSLWNTRRPWIASKEEIKELIGISKNIIQINIYNPLKDLAEEKCVKSMKLWILNENASIVTQALPILVTITVVSLAIMDNQIIIDRQIVIVQYVLICKEVISEELKQH